MNKLKKYLKIRCQPVQTVPV